MVLDDIINVPSSSRSSHTTRVQICMLKGFAPITPNNKGILEPIIAHRVASHTNVDLWVDGQLYPMDPVTHHNPTFHNAVKGKQGQPTVSIS